MDDVRVATGPIRIVVSEMSPGSGCIVTTALTQPIAIVVIPNIAGEPAFIDHASQSVCR